LLTSLFFV
jgi:hypothetical protein